MRESVLFVFVLLLLTACSERDSVHEFLDSAEYYMEARPDTAYTILENIPNPEELKGKEQARYALLMTQAMDKNYMEITSDSLIFLALSYYKENKKEIVQKAKAHFYYGRYLKNLEAYEDAKEHLYKTILLLENTEEYKLLGLACEDLGNIDFDLELYDDAFDYYQKSLYNFIKQKDSVSICYNYRNVGLVYSKKGEIDSTLYYYNKALEIATKKNIKYESVILQNISSYYRSLGNYDDAEFYINEAIAKGCYNSYSCNLSLGYVCLLKENYEEAELLLEYCLESPNVFTRSDAYAGLCELEKSRNNFEEALEYKELADSLLLEGLEYMDDDKRKIINLSRNFLQARYEERTLKLENESIKRRNIAIIVGSALCMALVGLCCVLISHKRRIKEIETDIAENSKKIVRYKGLISYYEKQHEELKINKEEEVNRLKGSISTLTEQNDSLKLRIKSQKRLDRLTENNEINRYMNGLMVYISITGDETGQRIERCDEEDFLQFFNFLFNGFVDRVKERSIKRLTAHELELACFIKLGYSNDAIGGIFNTQPTSVSKAKSRLKSRLNLADNENLDIILKLL